MGTRAPHVPYLDSLKVLLVALIIVWHGIAGYTDLESAWPYQDVQEVGLAEFSNNLLAGRKRPRTFARDRAVRLGVPLLLWVLVIWPLLNAAMRAAVAEPTSNSWELLHGDPLLDTGPTWFVELLLIYSLGYAAWRRWDPDTRTRTTALRHRGGRWLRWPYGSRSRRCSYASSWPAASSPPAMTRTYSSSVGSSGRRSHSQRSKVRSWSAGRSGCSLWHNGT